MLYFEQVSGKFGKFKTNFWLNILWSASLGSSDEPTDFKLRVYTLQFNYHQNVFCNADFTLKNMHYILAVIQILLQHCFQSKTKRYIAT